MPMPATVAASPLRNDLLRHESAAIGSVFRWMQHIPQSYKVEYTRTGNLLEPRGLWVYSALFGRVFDGRMVPPREANRRYRSHGAGVG
jgi:hypothetical protein